MAIHGAVSKSPAQNPGLSLSQPHASLSEARRPEDSDMGTIRQGHREASTLLQTLVGCSPRRAAGSPSGRPEGKHKTQRSPGAQAFLHLSNFPGKGSCQLHQVPPLSGPFHQKCVFVYNKLLLLGGKSFSAVISVIGYFCRPLMDLALIIRLVIKSSDPGTMVSV